MRVGIRDAERLKDSPSSAPVCALGRLLPCGGKALGCSNREEFAPLWDVWIHILGIGAECACWGAGGPVCRPYGGNVASPGGAPSRRALQKGCLEPAPQGEGFWVKRPSAVWLDRQSFTPLTRETAAYGRVRIPGPYGDCGKPAGAQCAPLQERGRKPGPSSAPVCALGHLSLSPLSLRAIIPTPFGLRPFPPDRGNRPLDKGSRPPGGRLRKNKKGQVWDLSLKT